MEKTKLGISTGLFVSAVYALVFFGGYTPAVLLVGFALLMESDAWLKHMSVKALVLGILFDLASAFINFIPKILNWISSIVSEFGGDMYLYKVTNIFSIFDSLLHIFEIVLFVLLIIKALKKQTINVGFVEKLISKHIG